MSRSEHDSIYIENYWKRQLASRKISATCLDELIEARDYAESRGHDEATKFLTKIIQSEKDKAGV